MLPGNRFTSKSNHAGDRKPHHNEAPSGSPVFRIAAGDIGNWALRGYARWGLRLGDGFPKA